MHAHICKYLHISGREYTVLLRATFAFIQLVNLNIWFGISYRLSFKTDVAFHYFIYEPSHYWYF